MTQSSWCCSLGLLLGRWCIAAIFLIAGIVKFMSYDATAAFMAVKGLPSVPYLLYAAAILEILCGLALIFGFWTRLAAVILLLYLIPVTYIFHDFWNVPSPELRYLQLWMFLKNLAIFGGLLYVISVGAGSWSCGCCCKKSSPTKS